MLLEFINQIKKISKCGNQLLEKCSNGKPTWKDTIQITGGMVVAVCLIARSARVLTGIEKFIEIYALILFSLFIALAFLSEAVKYDKWRWCKFLWMIVYHLFIFLISPSVIIYLLVIKNGAQKPDNVFFLFEIIMGELLVCTVLIPPILLSAIKLGEMISNLSEQNHYMLRDESIFVFIALIITFACAIIYEKIALKLLKQYEKRRNRPENEIRYDHMYQKTNLILIKYYILLILFAYATFCPDRLKSIPQGDFINVLTVMTVVILCVDKTKELYGKLLAWNK